MIVQSYNCEDFNVIYFEKDMDTAIKKGERLLKLRSVTKVEYEDVGEQNGEE